jgi:heparin binding hemagglutinin HbhA
MAVSLPTAADVRKVRREAAKNAAERAEVARTPLLAVLGAGDYAVSTVVGVVHTARTRATAQAEDVQQRVAELPARLSPAEVRKAVAELRADLRDRAEGTYVGLAERGETAWDRLRKQPRVKQALSTIEDYTEKLDARVDDLVDDAHDAAEKALATVTRQTRSTGERFARASRRFAGEAADSVAETGVDVSQTVAERSGDVAAAIDEAGDEAAAGARRTSHKTADRTAPKTATRRPATRRTGSSTSGS